MNRQPDNRHFPASGPIANVIVVIVGVLTIAAFIVLGVFAAVALGGIILLLAGILGIRMWWLNRKLTKSGSDATREGRQKPADITVIEGEYKVVSDNQQEPRKDEP